jgi:hypothetical protein
MECRQRSGGRALGDPLILHGADDRYLVYGRTENDRWLFAVFVMRPRSRVRVLTARDMTEREKRLYRRKRRGHHEGTP